MIPAAPQPELRVPLPEESPVGSPDLEEFYRQFLLPLVRRAVRRYALSVEDAGDVVQDAFMLAIAKLDATRNLKAWLYQVVDHLASNRHRKIERRAQLLERWEPLDPGRRRPDGPVVDRA